MKKISVFICVHLWTIFLFVSVSAQDFKTVRDGIEYAEMTKEIDNAPVKMNLLRLDLTKVRLDVVHAMDAAIGTETVSSMATRYGAFAAINAGFFRLDKSIFAGDAAGVLQIDGKLLSESINNRTAIGITNEKDKTEIIFGNLEAKSWILFGTDIEMYASGVNRERKKDEMIIYKPDFGRKTLTTSEGTEIVFKVDCPDQYKVLDICSGKFLEIREGKGNTVIPSNGYVVSVGNEPTQEFKFFVNFFKKHPELGDIRFSKEIVLADNQKKGAFAKAEDITNGVPQLIKNGKIEITWQEEKSSKSFVETKHPRTAVAKLKDGKFLMVTVDGRSEASGGIGLQNLAEILLELGATDAMNLDGGGSTTMFLDGKVVNKPSDKEGERRVGDAILVTPRNK